MTVDDDLIEGARCVDLAADFVERYSYDEFIRDPHVQNAGCMLLIRLREVVARLPDHFKDEYPWVPWSQIRAMGNVVAHEYSIRADPKLVWNALVNDFPQLTMFSDPPEGLAGGGR